MPKHEFGIIDKLNNEKEYNIYEPEKYSCISIDDEIIYDLVDEFEKLNTYFHKIENKNFGLAYFGVTILPPSSLILFLDIIKKNENKFEEDQYQLFVNLIQSAINNKKHMIHFGI